MCRANGIRRSKYICKIKYKMQIVEIRGRRRRGGGGRYMNNVGSFNTRILNYLYLWHKFVYGESDKLFTLR